VKPRFSAKALTFLRGLKRHNDREWFNARKGEYERLVRDPMVELVNALAIDLAAFSPELVADPRRSIFRIHRDTRFSGDKSPYKTHVAAVFPHRDLPKIGGACLYVEVAPQWVWAGGGLYAPDTRTLQAEREHIAGNHRRLRAIVDSPVFRRALGRLEGGEKLRRVPRGFPLDHPAADYLRCRMFVAGREFPAAFATSPRFYTGLLAVFRQAAPLVRFLNEPLAGRARRDPGIEDAR
jgi:uncharacterized protein (TIGR02453 family)